MDALIRFRWVLITGIFLLIIGGIPHLKKALSPNNELRIWFVENDPNQDFNQTFGNDRVIVLARLNGHKFIAGIIADHHYTVLFA